MAKKLVCVFGSEFYSDHARLLASYMNRNQGKQVVRFVQTEVPLTDEPKPPKPTRFRALLRRKSDVKKEPGPPPYAKALSEAYEALSKCYQTGDEIVLFVVTGVEKDWEVLREGARALAEHLEAGTEPPGVVPTLDTTTHTDKDIFGDQPQHKPPSHLIGKRVESSLVIVYRSIDPVSEINNFLLRDFPLSVKHIFSFNWSSGRENYCDTYRDSGGQVTSREVCYFKDVQWHIPVVTNATMNFIQYQSKHTNIWNSIKAPTPRTLTSLPTPLILECPPPITNSPPPQKSTFIWRMGRRRSTARSTTLPSVRTARRTSTLMSGFTAQKSDTSNSNFSTGPLVSSPPPSRMGSVSDPTSSSGSTGSSHTSTVSTQSSQTSTDPTQTSCTSIDSNLPTLREAYISLPGMTKHQVWAYPAFRNRDYGLPERVVWRSSRE